VGRLDLELRHLFMRLPVDPEVAGSAGERTLGLASAALLVALGGAAGALLRAAIERAVGTPAGGWPWGTLAINVSGAGVLAFLLVLLEERFPAARLPRPLLGTGVLGGYTTFSTFAVEVVQLVDHHAAALALGYVAASVCGALLAAFVGVLAGRSLARITDRPRWHRRVHHQIRQAGAAEEVA
jgi:CrcB protein